MSEAFNPDLYLLFWIDIGRNAVFKTVGWDKSNIIYSLFGLKYKLMVLVITVECRETD